MTRTRTWLSMLVPGRKRIELEGSDGATLTLVAWQRESGRFAPVRLDRAEAEAIRSALQAWLDANGDYAE